MTRSLRFSVLCAALVLVAGCGRSTPPPPPQVDLARTVLGPIVAEVGADRAVLWAKADEAGHWRAVVRGAGLVRRVKVTVDPAADGIVRARFDGLVPASTYEVRAWFVTEGGRDAGFRVPEGASTYVFRTAPPADAPAAVDFVFGADLAGQNVCRHGETGFPIFGTMAALEPAFFLALGDMVYADDPCERMGRYLTTQVPGLEAPAQTLEDYRRVWRYTREDATYAAFLARTPLFATWDDHEIANDAHPGVERFAVAARAFREYNPVLAEAPAGGGLYRRIRWGAHLEIFLLDTRSFRAPQAEPDRGAAPKSMLGEAQRRWLVDGLRASDATWKLVASSVPLAIPTGSAEARDGWADGGGETGYEREIVGILREVAEAGVRDLVFLAGDVHFATALRYRPFEDLPDFVLNEIVVGPLQAGAFRSDALDETLRPDRRFLYGADPEAQPIGWARATPFFTFGRVAVDERGRLIASIVNTAGSALYTSPLTPSAAARRAPEPPTSAPVAPEGTPGG